MALAYYVWGKLVKNSESKGGGTVDFVVGEGDVVEGGVFGGDGVAAQAISHLV